MGGRSKRRLAQRARANHAQKMMVLKRQRLKEQIKIEPLDDIDPSYFSNVDVKQEPEAPKEEDNWYFNDDNEDGEKYSVSAEQFGGRGTTGYSDCQNNSDYSDGANSMEAPMAPSWSSSYDASSNAKVSVGQENLCLLCYHKCDPLDDASETKENVFRTMFIMKKMLQVPNDMLEDYLLNFGSPNRWMSLCVKCKDKVDKALVIQKQISKLERTLKNFQAEMVDSVKKSVARLPEVPVPSIVHVLRVTNETRAFISTSWIKKSSIAPKNIRRPTGAKHPVTVTTSAGSWGGNGNKKKKSVKLKKQNKTKRCHAIINDFSSPTSTHSPHSDIPTPLSEDSSNQEFSAADEVEAPPNLKGKEAVDLVHQDRVVPLKRKARRAPVPLPQSILNDAITSDEKMYACNLCPHLEKIHFHHFVAHILFHHRRPYRCSLCNTYYTNLEELKHSPLNEKRLKEDPTGHVCTQETLVRTKFLPEKIWSCEDCSELFDLESQRDEHEKEFHSSESVSELKHGCKTCGRKCRNLKDWSLHRAIEHPDVALLSCYFCDENFGRKTKEGVDFNIASTTTTNNHLRKQHIVNKPTNFQVVTCDFCGENFTGSTDLQKHVREGHGLNPNRAFSCSICLFRTDRISSLKAHMILRHKAGTQEKYVCESCGYSASERVRFDVHNLEKHGIRPERGGVRTCKVEGCTFEYLYKQHFDKHMMLVHGSARKHTCQYCGKGFLNANNRREHENIHLNKVEKPFKCKICGNSFALRNYLYIHMRLSHLNRPFASTHKKRPSRKSFSQRPSTSNFGSGPSESNASGNFSSSQGIIPDQHQSIHCDQSKVQPP